MTAILLDTPASLSYCPPMPLHPDISELLPDRAARSLTEWLRSDLELLARAAYNVTTTDGLRSADGEDEVQQLALELCVAAYDDASTEIGDDVDNYAFASADEAQHWLTVRATTRVRSRRGLVSQARPEEIVGHVRSAGAIEARIDFEPVFAFAETRTGRRADTLLACIRRDITYREAALELGLTRQRAQQCTAKLLEQLRKRARVQEAACR